MKKRKEIGFIGTGNMGEALIAGLLQAKFTTPEHIVVYDADGQRLRFIQKSTGSRRLLITITSAPDVTLSCFA